jgi:hypothetical protein
MTTYVHPKHAQQIGRLVHVCSTIIIMLLLEISVWVDYIFVSYVCATGCPSKATCDTSSGQSARTTGPYIVGAGAVFCKVGIYLDGPSVQMYHLSQ